MRPAAAIWRLSASAVQLDHVAILDAMIASDMLPIEAGFPPHARVAQRAREVHMHQPSDVLDSLPPPKRERARPVGGMTRRLGVGAHDVQPLEQERPELAQAVPAHR